MVMWEVKLACGSGIGVPAGDAFLKAWPLLELQSLHLKCIDIDQSLVVLPELLLPFNLSKFKYKSIKLFNNMRLESIFKHCLGSYFFFIYQTSEHHSS
ncbi:hypothetical protein SporoP17a_07515 [Sporosarcina ureae]|nr:hypothetical protein SporoP17a_07515 [Sporosarcina ureae]